MIRLSIIAIFCLVLVNCNKAEEAADIQETAQQIGDVMASADESGGTTSGTMSFIESQRRSFHALEKKHNPLSEKILAYLFPIQSVDATACGDTTFSSCSSSQKVRTLGGCTVGNGTFTGDITLTFSDSACVMNSNGDTVDRSPNFTVTGRRSATLAVTKTGTNGQRTTRTSAGQFTFSNDGIRRVFSLSGSTLFDYTTQTTSDITMTGTSRSDRVMTGGNLRVTDNLSSVTCNFAPTNVTWSSTCNCASSGSWAGTCSDGKSSSVDITGCGTANITIGSSTESLSFDRCYSTN